MPQIHENNLKVLKDQLDYEALINKKFSQYANFMQDQELKGLCQEAAQKHKQHFNDLLQYLNTHQ